MAERIFLSQPRHPGLFRLGMVVLLGLFTVLDGLSEPPADLHAGKPWRHGTRTTPSQGETPASRPAETGKVVANGLSKARAVSEAVAGGLAPEVAGDRPLAVDNSATVYFPPIGVQDHGDCTCWSSVYYYNTYTQACDEGLDASAGDLDALCSHRFMFSLINQGARGAEGTRYVITHVSDVGSANAACHSLTEDIHTWPEEAAWVQALRNRTGTPHSIRADTEDGLEAIRQHLANGNCIVTRGVIGENLRLYPDNNIIGIDNRVWYWRDQMRSRHSLCVVGYDDERSYVDHRDGKTHKGAFLVANSSWPDWGWFNTANEKGYFWIAYTMFLEGKFGWYDDPWPYTDPCYDNAPYPEMYYNDDRPHYRPRLYAVAGISHAKRNTLAVTGGIGATVAPDFLGPETIRQTAYGEIPIEDSRRVAVDLTDGADCLVPGVPTPVFVKLSLADGAGSNATITSADFFYDPEGDGTYLMVSSTDPTVTVTPGHSGFATVQITAPVTLCVDANATGNPVQDGTREHPCATIQAAIDAATGPAIVSVGPGTYREAVVMASDISLIGAGANRTFIDSQNAGEAIRCSAVTGVTVDGFAMTTSGTTQTALRLINSAVVVRHCVATGSGSGFGVEQTGSATLVNCLSHDNAAHGVWHNGMATLAVRNSTIAGNGGSGVVCWSAGTVTITDSILWGNGDDLNGSVLWSVSHCDISDGDFAGSSGTISQDPLFVTGPQHDYYLSQTAAGQVADSPCLDAGSTHAAFLDLNTRTTRTDEADDRFTVDMGYHAAYVLRITSIAQIGPDVQIQWNARPGKDYVVEWSGGGEPWHEVPVGAVGTWLDATTAAFMRRVYRVREK
ncbi:MAG: right-handed parallel beta-helix repeat-containing protein [Verrucomicrobia bacterium]|nr:right-handed parallel beta-helix repeat-containing protein [Verrucomicrobiota bacterium]